MGRRHSIVSDLVMSEGVRMVMAGAIGFLLGSALRRKSACQ